MNIKVAAFTVSEKSINNNLEPINQDTGKPGPEFIKLFACEHEISTTEVLKNGDFLA